MSMDKIDFIGAPIFVIRGKCKFTLEGVYLHRAPEQNDTVLFRPNSDIQVGDFILNDEYMCNEQVILVQKEEREGFNYLVAYL